MTTRRSYAPRLRLRMSLSLALLALALGSASASAQRIGFEAGLAGIENYPEITPSLGVALFLPLTERLRASASYSHWIGCDQNTTDAQGRCPDVRFGYGKRGINLVGLYQLAQIGELGASLGAGLGWYESFRATILGEREREWDQAFTFSGELRRPVALNSSVYLKGDLSFPTDDHIPRWGFLRVGVDVGVS